MAKKDCYLKHNRNLSTGYKYANYEYDQARSRATSKQLKFYQSLYYIFKDNGISINDELDKRNLEHCVIQHPTGRVGYSQAIDYMINILTDLGLYHSKNDKRDNFKRTYCSKSDSGGQIVRSWEEIKYVEEN